VAATLAFPTILHIGADHWFVPLPLESHHTFGTGFIVIGSLMAAEGLGGSVWHRSQLRRLILPAMLVFLGWGMIVVTFVEPQARLVHLAMGLPLIVGGWAEAHHRAGAMSRRYADAFVVPALLIAAFDTAAFHVSGAPLSGGFITHLSLAITAVAIAGARLYQAQSPTSLPRALLLAAFVGLIGLELYLDAVFL
jgi:hypothetical protein